MRKMEQLTEEELESEFLEQAKTFCSYIYDNADPKVVSGGRTITGTALGNLAEVYVEAIRSGKVPCLENAVVSLAKIQNVRAVDQALESYMTVMLCMVQLPMDPADLSDIHTVAEKEAIEGFITMSFNDNDQIYQQELMSEEVLRTYFKAKEEIGNMILQADQSLGAAEQEKEVQRLKKEILKQRQKGLEEQNRLQEQAFRDMQRNHDEHVNQIIHQMEREQERVRRDNERVLEAKLREQEILLQQDFRKEAAQMQSKIDSLKADMRKQETSQPSTISKVLDGIGTAATLVLPGFLPKVAGIDVSMLSKLLR